MDFGGDWPSALFWRYSLASLQISPNGDDLRIVISIFEWVASKQFSGQINAPALNDNLIDGCQIDNRSSKFTHRQSDRLPTRRRERSEPAVRTSGGVRFQRPLRYTAR